MRNINLSFDHQLLKETNREFDTDYLQAKFYELTDQLEELQARARKTGSKLFNLSGQAAELQAQREELCIELNGSHQYESEDGYQECLECQAPNPLEPREFEADDNL